MNLDICTAEITINEYTVVHRGDINPLNYVEVELLRFTFGERAVNNVVVIRTEESTNNDVLEGLRLKYGAGTVGEAFPGTRPRLPMEAPGDTPRRTAARTVPKASHKKKAAEKAPEEDAGELDETGETDETQVN